MDSPLAHEVKAPKSDSNRVKSAATNRTSTPPTLQSRVSKLCPILPNWDPSWPHFSSEHSFLLLLTLTWNIDLYCRLHLLVMKKKKQPVLISNIHLKREDNLHPNTGSAHFIFYLSVVLSLSSLLCYSVEQSWNKSSVTLPNSGLVSFTSSFLPPPHVQSCL